jgi:hypothetical protein
MSDKTKRSVDEPRQASISCSYIETTGSPLIRASKRLEVATRHLNYYTVAIVSTTAINLLLFGFSIASTSFPSLFGLKPRDFVLGSALPTCIVLIVGALYDRSRRRGGTIFEEISEEYQVDLRDRISSEVADTRLNLEVRLSMRDFSVSSKLPLVRGVTGPLIYLTFNLGLTLLAWLIVYLSIYLEFK